MFDASGLFVTGTDTDVGKTYVAALMIRAWVAAGRTVGVYKPAASGCRRSPDGTLICDDAVALWDAAGRHGELERVCPQRFAAPLAPNSAARAEGRTIDAALLSAGLEYWRRRSDVLVVEGAGGLFSPLTDELLNVDLARRFGLPLLVTAANRLGAIHAVLATVAAAGVATPQLPIAGVVLNDATADDGREASRATNAAELSRLLAPRGIRLFVVHHGTVAWSPGA